MPTLTLADMIIALIDLNYSALDISRMSNDDMYRIVYNEISK